MCLYPRLIKNPKYTRTQKNGGIIPPVSDKRVQWVPIGCGTCIECRKQYSRNWQTRLQEEIKEHTNGIFVTLTFSTEKLFEIIESIENPKPRKSNNLYRKAYAFAEKFKKLKGYDKDNAIATYAVRHFLERWRKEHKKSVRHWLVTELGHGKTEHIHLHGIIWTDKHTDIKKHWGYGFVWDGNEVNGKRVNYVNAKTVNYITKYITKIDRKHLNYKPVILCSSGIGRRYATSGEIMMNKYNGDKTKEFYRTNTGHKIGLPTYWRNKIYSEEEREKLWLQKLDKQERFVCGEKIDISKGEDQYYNVLNYHRDRTFNLGYPAPEFIWKRKKYEEQRRELIREERIKIIKRMNE